MIQRLKEYVRQKHRARVWEQRHTPLTHTGREMVDVVAGNREDMMHENMTGDDGNASWDPERWDTSQYHEDCQKCGATLHISGALGHVSAACPECNVLVYSL